MDKIKVFSKNNRIPNVGITTSILSPEGMIKLLELCREENVGVWGVEAHELHEDNITGSSPENTKFLSDSNKKETINWLINFISEKKLSNIGYSVILRNEVGDVVNFIQKNRIPNYRQRFIPKGKLVEFIELCIKNGIKSIAIETFFLIGKDSIRPSMALSRDLSMFSDKDKINQIELLLESTKNENVAFEIFVQ